LLYSPRLLAHAQISNGSRLRYRRIRSAHRQATDVKLIVGFITFCHAAKRYTGL
jgi:hypothetical protein